MRWLKAVPFVLAVLLTFGGPAALAEPAQPRAAASEAQPEEWSARCCKICRKGKACGDSCISRSKTCRAGPGCACNGSTATLDELDWLLNRGGGRGV